MLEIEEKVKDYKISLINQSKPTAFAKIDHLHQFENLPSQSEALKVKLKILLN